MTRKRLAILTTHPIQYHGRWFQELAAHPRIDLEVLFCHQATPREQSVAGFGIEFEWDISLLNGYKHRFLKNVAEQPSVSRFNGLDTPEIKEIIERSKFDGVLVNGWHYKSAWQAMRAAWKTGTPVMARSDSHLHTRRGIFKRISKWPFYRWFIPKLDACLAVGTWSRDYYLHYGAKPERIFLVPHTIDDEYFGKAAARLLPSRSELRAKWGIGSGATVFLFVGKFIEKKRPMDFVRALENASKRAPGVIGLMVGDGPLRRACEERAGQSHAPIRFAGFMNQSEMAKSYVAADALVLPSDGGETWGLVVNEAMACGRPCFVSDQVGCGPDMIAKDKTGETFPMGDQKTLGELLSTYAANPDRLNRMGERASGKSQAYTVSVAVAGVLQALEAVS